MLRSAGTAAVTHCETRDGQQAHAAPEIGGDHRWVRADLGRRTGGEGRPLVEHLDPVRGGEHHGDVVVDEEHAVAALVAQHPHQLHQLVGLSLVEPGRRFVEQHVAGFGGQSSGDAEQSGLAMGERGRQPAGVFRQPDQLER